MISSRGGPNQLWAIDRGGNEAPRLLSTGTLTPSAVAVAPDGRTAVLRIQGKGLYAVAVSGDAALRVLTSDPNDTSPTVTRDGKRALFTRQLADGARQIWSVPLEGGEPRPLLAPGTSGPSASPVDARVVGYVAGAREHERVPTLFDPERGTERPLSKHLAAGHYGSLHFSPDGRHVAIVRGSNVVAEVDLASGEMRSRDQRGGRSGRAGPLRREHADGRSPAVPRRFDDRGAPLSVVRSARCPPSQHQFHTVCQVRVVGIPVTQ